VLWSCVVAAYLNLEEGDHWQAAAEGRGFSPKAGTARRVGVPTRRVGAPARRVGSPLATLVGLTALAAVTNLNPNPNPSHPNRKPYP
jgi:hypothetical protein